MLGNLKYQCVYDYPAIIGRTMEQQPILVIYPYSIHTFEVAFFLFIME